MSTDKKLNECGAPQDFADSDLLVLAQKIVANQTGDNPDGWTFRNPTLANLVAYLQANLSFGGGGSSPWTLIASANVAAPTAYVDFTFPTGYEANELVLKFNGVLAASPNNWPLRLRFFIDGVLATAGNYNWSSIFLGRSGNLNGSGGASDNGISLLQYADGGGGASGEILLPKPQAAINGGPSLIYRMEGADYNTIFGNGGGNYYVTTGGKATGCRLYYDFTSIAAGNFNLYGVK